MLGAALLLHCLKRYVEGKLWKLVVVLACGDGRAATSIAAALVLGHAVGAHGATAFICGHRLDLNFQVGLQKLGELLLVHHVKPNGVLDVFQLQAGLADREERRLEDWDLVVACLLVHPLTVGLGLAGKARYRFGHWNLWSSVDREELLAISFNRSVINLLSHYFVW